MAGERAGDGARRPEGDAGDGGIEDEIPPEWILSMERKLAAVREDEFEKSKYAFAVLGVVAAVLGLGGVLTVVALNSSTAPASGPATPAAVQAFAKTLPESEQPDTDGLTVVDSTDAPGTWRVAWETQSRAFCFAFVHQKLAPQTRCDAAGSMSGQLIVVGGELADDYLDPPEIFACGYTQGEASYVEMDDGAVVGPAAETSSGSSVYCLQLPDGMAAGTSITVDASVNVEQSDGKYKVRGVSATYP